MPHKIYSWGKARRVSDQNYVKGSVFNGKMVRRMQNEARQKLS
jgi:hypothetical protein